MDVCVCMRMGMVEHLVPLNVTQIEAAHIRICRAIDAITRNGPRQHRVVVALEERPPAAAATARNALPVDVHPLRCSGDDLAVYIRIRMQSQCKVDT